MTPNNISCKDIKKLQSDAAEIEKNLLWALQCQALVQQANPQNIRKKFDNSFAAHAFNSVRIAVQNELTLSLCRLLEDKSKERVVLSSVIGCLSQNKENYHLLNQCIGHTQYASFDEMYKEFEKCRKEIKEIRKAYYEKKAKPLRNNHLAHTLLPDKKKYLEQNYLKYGDCDDALDALVAPVKDLLTIITGISSDYNDYKKEFECCAEAFWERFS